ncbi:MAG: hypothetical protein M3R38_12720 [Actinomycetota bacterium]|nr:hypothetical protein [Actinomycetota bacterium]
MSVHKEADTRDRGGSIEIAAMDPLISPPACLLCGERFEPMGYPEWYKPELLPGVAAEGFAPALFVEGQPSFAGFVCPGCFGDGSEDLARSMRRGADRLHKLAGELGAA